jgi:hemerythrin-like domain-containing protein
MLRDKNLIPLSRQHQHALALCVRIDRASPIADAELAAWQAEIVQHFESEIRIHFAAEEKVLFSAACKFFEMIPLVEELLAEHSSLRKDFALAEINAMSAQALSGFVQRLSTHIRKEERRLFQRLQELMTPDELAAVGKQLEVAMEGTSQVCVLPARTGNSRPKN